VAAGTGFSLPLLAAFWAGAAAEQAPAAPAPRPGGCVEGPAEPSVSPRLRPTQRAICNYEPAEFHRRLFRLLGAREGTLGIEAVERLFGLPRVNTAFDNVRSANYSIILEGAAPARWSALVSLDESFGPDIESRPARFRGTLQPMRINPRERGEISIHVVLLGPTRPGEPFCLSTAALDGAARRLGWRGGAPTVAMDSGSVTLRLERGDLGLSYSPADCIDSVALDQPGNPPIVPITAAESDALRRQSNTRMADELVERILARRSDGPDAEALRGWARMFFGSMSESMDPLEAVIQAMAVEELRRLAYRAIIGHYWGANREHCIAAIETGDVRAALARAARERGWSLAELRALEAECYIFLDGRSYRYREFRPPEAPAAGQRP